MLKTPEEQANYLVSQAKAFMNSKEFAEATKTAQYVLSNVDSNSHKVLHNREGAPSWEKRLMSLKSLPSKAT